MGMGSLFAFDGQHQERCRDCIKVNKCNILDVAVIVVRLGIGGDEVKGER